MTRPGTTAAAPVAAARAGAAEAIACRALLNCLLRELSPVSHGEGIIELRHTRRLLRHGPGGDPCRPLEPVAGGWAPVGRRRLAELVAAELTAATGRSNAEFLTQVARGHRAVAAILAARAAAAPPRCPYLASEQALVAGHRHHPAPKDRPGDPREWLAYAPEAHARFPLRFLAVRAGALAAEGDGAGFARLAAAAPPAPPGYAVLPAHPWQLRLLRDHPALRAARAAGLIRDLGQGAAPVLPTSSVRTVYDPAAGVFAKFSLDVRLTNCVRRHAWYELAARPVLARALAPVTAALARRFPGTVVLAETGTRGVDVGDRSLFEGLAVVVRESPFDRLPPGVVPVLAAALTEPGRPGEPDPAWPLPTAPGAALDWWAGYVGLLVPPVLAGYAEHGVVFEPHLQNVLVGVAPAGPGGAPPRQVVLRDLEGVKLVADRHAATLAALPARVAQGLGRCAGAGLDRVLYCLVVNNLAGIAAAVAARSGVPERELWGRARQIIAGTLATAGPALARLADPLLARPTLPAKANLLLRWARGPDRAATYVPIPNPLAGAGS